MSKKQDKSEFDDYLQGHSSISRLYAKLRAEQEQENQPSPDTDEQILRAARRRGAEYQGDRDTSKPSWHVPTSIAAVLVLSFVLVLYYRHEHVPMRDYTTERDTPSRETAAPAVGSRQQEAQPHTDARLRKKAEPAEQAEIKSRLTEQSPQRGDQPPAVSERAPQTTAVEQRRAMRDEATGADALGAARFDTAAQWLEHIRQLLEREDLDRARSEWEAFERQYPGYGLEDFPQVERFAASLRDRPAR